MLDILIGTLVDQVEQLRKAVAQIEAASAAVTNVKYAAQLCIKVGFVVKRLLLPGNRVPGGGVKAAFALGLSSIFRIIKSNGRNHGWVAPAGYGPCMGREGMGPLAD